MPSCDPQLWESMGRLLDRAGSLDDLRAHGLQLLAYIRWRELGRPIPVPLVAEARTAAMMSLAARPLLQRVRELCDGPIVLLKGPETAAWYPQPSLRPFCDLDLLVPDGVAVQRTLIANGFTPLGDERLYLDGHQFPALAHPDFPLLVEVHRHPHWVDGISPPPVDELFDAIVDSVVPVAGVSALPATQHAVLLAVHAWAHEPLGSLRGLIDIGVARHGVAAQEANALARAWGVESIWRATGDSIDALLFGARRPWPLRVWARHLHDVRERTVLETHLVRWLAAFSAFPAGRAASIALRALGADLRPAPDEDWPPKLRRTRAAVRNAFVGRSRHATELENALGAGQP